MYDNPLKKWSLVWYCEYDQELCIVGSWDEKPNAEQLRAAALDQMNTERPSLFSKSDVLESPIDLFLVKRHGRLEMFNANQISYSWHGKESL